MQKEIYLLSPTPREGTISLPMIDFKLTADRLDLKGSDTLMFTSKQAVISADAIDASWKTYPCIAIGPATKKQIEALGGKVVYHPKSFYGETLSRDIATFFRRENCFICAPKRSLLTPRGFWKKRGFSSENRLSMRPPV